MSRWADWPDAPATPLLARLASDDAGGLHPGAGTAESVGGRVLLTAGANQSLRLPVTRLYTKDVSLLGFVISRASLSDLAAAAELINGMLDVGSLTARATEVLPLSATADVHARLEAGQILGRVLVRAVVHQTSARENKRRPGGVIVKVVR